VKARVRVLPRPLRQTRRFHLGVPYERHARLPLHCLIGGHGGVLAREVNAVARRFPATPGYGRQVSVRVRMQPVVVENVRLLPDSQVTVPPSLRMYLYSTDVLNGMLTVAFQIG
jgi:hypothetical protein